MLVGPVWGGEVHAVSLGKLGQLHGALGLIQQVQPLHDHAGIPVVNDYIISLKLAALGYFYFAAVPVIGDQPPSSRMPSMKQSSAHLDG
ncbi:hypothetical protein LHU53_18705 [Rhodoferax sp. U2-2l]|uniref:hypothetical protein n=1 Tax=Rhodoferax sp. U2-2l TaxID=2884000 RepID=UPI001D09F1D8|nr:hypothetical protein [Rhodoferax sp. U2-2l]MCB8748925.1 hypothetical protein [Rhodoferax sp. U2-2l]